MQINAITPRALAARLAIYFGCVIGLMLSIGTFTPWAQFLPMGGHELDLPGTAQNGLEALTEQGGSLLDTQSRLTVALVLTTSLAAPSPGCHR